MKWFDGLSDLWRRELDGATRQLAREMGMGWRPYAEAIVEQYSGKHRDMATYITEFGQRVDKAVEGAPTSATQKAALVSLAYSQGMLLFARSDVLKHHTRGDYTAAAAAFALCNERGLKGVARRREAEAELYRT